MTEALRAGSPNTLLAQWQRTTWPGDGHLGAGLGAPVAGSSTRVKRGAHSCRLGAAQDAVSAIINSISGLVVEYIVAIDVTRVRFPADAYHAPMAKNKAPSHWIGRARA